MVIVAGRLSSLLILVAYGVWLVISQYLIENDIVKTTVRKITAVEQIDDAIDRSVEMGRGVMFTTGAFANLSGRSANATIAGLQILGYVSKKCAERNVNVIAPVVRGNLIPITADVVEEAFKLSDKVYDISNVHYYGQTFFSYVLGMYRELQSEIPGAWFGIGACYDEINMIPVHMSGKDVFTVGASSDISYQAAVMMGPDAWLLGEELYAVANYVSETKAGVGSLFANDWTKIGILILIVVGSVLPKIVLDILAM
jgi:hypothetical protein